MVQILQPYYIVYIDINDSNKIKAENGFTGAIDYSGTDARVIINDAISAADSSAVYVRVGTYDISSGTIAMNNSNASLILDPGTILQNSSATQAQVLVNILASDCYVIGGQIQGKLVTAMDSTHEVAANGIGIQFGSSTQAVFRSSVIGTRISNCYYGVYWATPSSPQTGLCKVYDTNVAMTQEAYVNDTFTAFLYGYSASQCRYGYHATNFTRTAVKAYGGTLNSCTRASVKIDKAQGSLFDGLWMENSANGLWNGTAMIELGSSGTTDFADCTTMIDINIGAYFGGESYIIWFLQSEDCYIDTIALQNGTQPWTAFFLNDANNVGLRNRIHKVTYWAGPSPSAVPIYHGTGSGQVVLNYAPNFNNSNTLNAVQSLPNLGAVTTVTVQASGNVYQNSGNIGAWYMIIGGSGIDVQWSADNSAFYDLGALSRIYLEDAEYFKLNYTSAPLSIVRRPTFHASR